MKSVWRVHNGKRFFYADYSNFGRNIDALRIEVDGADSEIEREPAALVLVDIRNTVTSADVVALFKESTARTKGHVERTAVIGVTGVQKILVSAVAHFSRETLHLFNDVGEAMEWLVGGAGTGGVRVRP